MNNRNKKRNVQYEIMIKIRMSSILMTKYKYVLLSMHDKHIYGGRKAFNDKC